MEDTVGMADVSKVSAISKGFSFSLDGETFEGDGDNTMDGARPCLLWILSFGLESEGVGKGDGRCGDGGIGVFAAIGLEGSQLCPGLIIRLMISPSFTLYSFKSFPSARALPLRRRRCASGEGAEG